MEIDAHAPPMVRGTEIIGAARAVKERFLERQGLRVLEEQIKGRDADTAGDDDHLAEVRGNGKGVSQQSEHIQRIAGLAMADGTAAPADGGDEKVDGATAPVDAMHAEGTAP